LGPLKGIRILDMTSVLMGPYATQILGDHGADVIKIEPLGGDVIRQIGPARNPGMGPLFLNTNRSKRSIALDLKSDGGREVLLRLAGTVDALVTNVRPRAMDRLGLSWEVLHKANPKLIYASLVGFDQTGPYAARPAYDDLIQGGACISHGFERAGRPPSYVPAAAADRIVGLAAVNAILAALVERGTSGTGQKIEVPMFETMLSMILGDHLGGLTFDPPLDAGGYKRLLSPDRRPYRTSDGYVCALIYSDDHWARFFKAIGQPEMPAADPRYATFAARMQNIDAVYAELGQILLTRSTEDWLTLFDAADVPAMPMHSYESVLQDPHLVATGFFERTTHPTEGDIVSMAVPWRYSRTQPAPARLAPGLGEHGSEILSEMNYTDEDISALRANGILGGAI
jgi:crotonobetainyl-CoA:carnitine CoA-transferase CaiB-like acyl-CoA transferase